MVIKQFLVGGDRNFGYLVADENEKMALAVDPSYSPEQLVNFSNQKGYQIKYIFNTHNHYDHTNGNKMIEKLTGIKPLMFEDKDPDSGLRITDGVVLELGNLKITIIHTPGHTPDSICIYVGDALFTGDTLFVGKVGGTGFGQDARDEYHSIHDKLLTLPEATRVFPGHNYGVAPESTILNEIKSNPFLLQPDFDSFVNLKKNWAEYKRIHGIA